MHFARFAVKETIAYGVVHPEAETVTAIDGHPFGPHEVTSATLALADVRLLPPVLPTKIVGIGKNYAAHAKEMGSEAPTTPVMFLKPSTAVVGPDDAISLPGMSSEVEFEGELAIVIGRLAKDVPIGRVSDAILGYMCANDVTARDLQRDDGQWVRAKGFDTFCPVGPWITTGIDPGELTLKTLVNGELKQSTSTDLMVHSPQELVSFVSSVMTLLPGDVILTGTPAGVGRLSPGDEVVVEIEALGSLTNRVTQSSS